MGWVGIGDRQCLGYSTQPFQTNDQAHFSALLPEKQTWILKTETQLWSPSGGETMRSPLVWACLQSKHWHCAVNKCYYSHSILLPSTPVRPSTSSCIKLGRQDPPINCPIQQNLVHNAPPE